ncbi:hypothetical protein HMY34_04215 [Thiothrix subterranea]|uniref:hypothetical protein n=1 Tax=Thiothrix subterranea TaxID=2735563 RepID=UPI00192C2B5C|nr:hypothetical protein [Thiothrix subterranea]QQZ28020.1 hypothetical protein HMY34_04215 [Thiothrix subterranea]
MDLHHVIDIARPVLSDYLLKYLRSRVNILIVVDNEISLSPGANAFGIERVIRLLRDTSVGCMHFQVDVGLRSNVPFSVVASPVGTAAKYVGFRFDSTLPAGGRVIDAYDEVWCFGFKPDNFGGSDANITAPGALPASNAELAVLTTWMNNRKGGVFATGDHDYLGASMCHRIPRVGTMRAWTNAQGVPPVGTALRIDTNRPANAAEMAGTEVIEFDRQDDAVPQPIQWKAWLSFSSSPWHIRKRPHPVLCHPTLGPIDVMPDHPHEGVVFDHVPQPDVGLAAITLGNNYNFGVGVTGAEYPTAGGVQPLPMVIAHGTTLADPPLQHAKGDSPAKRFAMINVYDGHRANVGRVATDSTWHHWMNINITQIEAVGGANWEKIKRYYLNLAVWLAPPEIPRHCFFFHTLESLYSYPGIEEFHPKVNLLDAGLVFRKRLIGLYGPCWVTQFVFDWLGLLDLKLRERLIERYLLLPMPNRPIPPRPDPCLSCPPPEMFEAVILGGAIRATSAALFANGGGLEAGLKLMLEMKPERLEKYLLEGTAEGLKQLQALSAKSCEETKQLFG